MKTCGENGRKELEAKKSLTKLTRILADILAAIKQADILAAKTCNDSVDNRPVQ